MGDEHIGADHAVPADHGVAAQDRGAGVDGHIVLDGGMPPLAPEALAAPGGQSAQGHALVDLDPGADHAGLADDDAGAVVDEEMVADGGAGVDIDARFAVGMLAHDPGEHGHLQQIQLMGQPVDGHGEEARVAEYDLVGREGRRVTVEEGGQVRLGHGPDGGDPLQEGQHGLLGLQGRPIPQGGPEDQLRLLGQVEGHVLDQHGQVVTGIIDPAVPVPGAAGVDDPQQLVGQVHDHIPVRLSGGVQPVDVPAQRIVLQDAVHDRADLLFDHKDPLLFLSASVTQGNEGCKQRMIAQRLPCAKGAVAGGD